MKKILGVIALGLLLLGCMRTAVFLPGELSATDCYLCGRNEGSQMAAYRGRNSLGILCTDKFAVFDIFASACDGWGRKKKENANRLHMIIRGESHGTIATMGIVDRPAREVDIVLEEGDRLSLGGLEGVLCRECNDFFAQLQAEREEGLADVFLVDFLTAKVYPLDISRHFFVGDYFVIIDAGECMVTVTVVYVPKTGPGKPVI